MIVLAIATAVLHMAIPDSISNFLRFPDSDNGLQTAVQVVPAIVIAIFVFAVGTLFVVAQVVPLARGTRAVALLRKRYLAWTISPALALAPLSAIVLVLEQGSQELASALLLGATVYLFASTACLLAVLGEATDPEHFGALLVRHYRGALKTLRQRLPQRSQQSAQGKHVPFEEKARRFPRRNAQAAIDDLYDVLRTLRGWARSAATTGDSRELQVALEVTLELVHDYAGNTGKHERALVPTNYWHNAYTWRTNPLYWQSYDELDEGDHANSCEHGARRFMAWTSWTPPALRLAKPGSDARVGGDGSGEERVRSGRREAARRVRSASPGREQVSAEASSLPSTWVANEVGRAMVRAVELGTTSRMLLERDRGRLLLSMEKASRLMMEHEATNAGVMVGYIIELGLGARRCPAEELEWHFGPLAALATLHCDLVASDRAGQEVDSSLVVGSAAGVLLVAEAITAARLRTYCERHTIGSWSGAFAAKRVQEEGVETADGQGSVPPNQETELSDIENVVTRTVSELRAMRGMERFTLSTETHPSHWQATGGVSAKDLATHGHLEPRALPAVHPANEALIGQLFDQLKQPPA